MTMAWSTLKSSVAAKRSFPEVVRPLPCAAIAAGVDNDRLKAAKVLGMAANQRDEGFRCR